MSSKKKNKKQHIDNSEEMEILSPLGKTTGDFLSAEEVDALLRGVTGETDTYFEENDNIPRSYNMGTQERIVRGRIPGLELINEYFARFFRINLYKKIQRNVEISVGPIRVQKYSEFIRNLVIPTSLNIIHFKQSLYGNGLIVFDPNLIFLTVDNVFGNDGRFHFRTEGREFTPTENLITDELFKTFKKSYLKSFNRYYPLKMKFLRREINSQFAPIASPSEIVVSTTFTIEFGGACSDMHICFPYSSIEPIKDILTNQMISEDTVNIKQTYFNTSNIQSRLVISAQLGILDIENISNLKIGDEFPIYEYTATINQQKIFNIKLKNNQFYIGEKMKKENNKNNHKKESLDNNKTISKISVKLSVELGDKTITIEELSKLTRGSVIQLDQLAGETLTILANNTPIGRGEVVVVNDKYGIKVIDIINE